MIAVIVVLVILLIAYQWRRGGTESFRGHNFVKVGDDVLHTTINIDLGNRVIAFTSGGHTRYERIHTVSGGRLDDRFSSHRFFDKTYMFLLYGDDMRRMQVFMPNCSFAQIQIDGETPRTFYSREATARSFTKPGPELPIGEWETTVPRPVSLSIARNSITIDDRVLMIIRADYFETAIDLYTTGGKLTLLRNGDELGITGLVNGIFTPARAAPQGEAQGEAMTARVTESGRPDGIIQYHMDGAVETNWMPMGRGADPIGSAAKNVDREIGVLN